MFKLQVSDIENDVKYMHLDHVLVYGKRTHYFYCKLFNMSLFFSLVVCVYHAFNGKVLP